MTFLLNLRIFDDNTNVVASSPCARDLENQLRKSWPRIKEWCNLKKLNLNIKKTNYMIVKYPKQKSGNTLNYEIKMEIVTLLKKDNMYLGVLLDERLSWKHHIAYVCSRIARNTEIFS